MAEVLSPQEFTELKIAPLTKGQSAFHGMLHPGVYVSDREWHATALAGGTINLDIPFFKAVTQAVNRGAIIRQLRVLPKPDQFGYTKADVAAMKRTAAMISSTGEQIRTIDFDLAAQKLRRTQGVNPTLACQYLDSAGTEDPKAGFWSVRRVAAGSGKIALEYFELMDYVDEVFQGHQTVEPPISDDMLAYEQFWQGLYWTYGEEK